MEKMKGVIVPMTTPFLDNGTVDYDTISKTTKFLIEKGIKYLYPCGTTGEMHLLSTEERIQIAETVIETAKRKAFVFVQCGSVTETETITLIEHAKSAGSDGIGVVTPSFFGLNEKEMVGFYSRISEVAGKDFPIYLYNIPQCSGNDITFSACSHIAEQCQNVVGIKYSLSDANRVCDYLSIRNYDFSVLVGLERQYLGYLAMGCDGVVSGCASVTPKLFLGLYDAFLSGNMENALKLQRKVDRVYKVLTKNKSIARVKAGEHILGLGNGLMRSPLTPITLEEYHELEKELKEFLN